MRKIVILALSALMAQSAMAFDICIWRGKAPFCRAKCQSNETMTMTNRDNCWIGKKAQCCSSAGDKGVTEIGLKFDEDNNLISGLIIREDECVYRPRAGACVKRTTPDNEICKDHEVAVSFEAPPNSSCSDGYGKTRCCVGISIHDQDQDHVVNPNKIKKDKESELVEAED